GRTAAMDAEYRARMAAAFAWMQDSLRLARERGVAGILIFAQADPDFEQSIRRRRGDGFAEFRDALRDLAVAFGKPVLFVHGATSPSNSDSPSSSPRAPRTRTSWQSRFSIRGRAARSRTSPAYASSDRRRRGGYGAGWTPPPRSSSR